MGARTVGYWLLTGAPGGYKLAFNHYEDALSILPTRKTSQASQLCCQSMQFVIDQWYQLNPVLSHHHRSIFQGVASCLAASRSPSSSLTFPANRSD